MTHACYLLRSLNPRFKTSFYIGCTTDPRRRLRQHNGEVGQGAQFTKKKRPWEMVLCVYGFSSHVNALQFEWAWQHPLVSLSVKEAAAKLPSLKGVPGMIKLVCTMVTLPRWNSLNLTLQFMLSSLLQHRHGSPPLPPQMRLFVAPMHSLPDKDSGDDNDDNDDLSTCPDDLSQSVDLDEDSYLNASSCSVDLQARVTEGGSTVSDTIQMIEREQNLLESNSVRSVELQQKSVKTFFPVRKQGAVPSNNYRKSRNGEICPVLEDHSNTRNVPSGVESKGNCSGILQDSKNSCGEKTQDAALIIDSDDDEIQEISVTQFKQSTQSVQLDEGSYLNTTSCNVHLKVRIIEGGSTDDATIQLIERDKTLLESSSVKGVELQQMSVKTFFPGRKQGAAPSSIYRKSRNGEICKVLEDHSNTRNVPSGVKSKGKCSGILQDSQSSCRERIQDAALIIYSDDDEIQEISLTEFKQSTFVGEVGGTGRKERVCSLSNFR